MVYLRRRRADAHRHARFDYDSTFFGIDVLLSDNQPIRLIALGHDRDIALFDGRNLFEIGFRKTSAQ